MGEPIKTVKNGEPGRPSPSEEQFQKWLDDMAPFLKLGQLLYTAMTEANLVQHKDVIYVKYRLKDWFAEKVDNYRATPGKLVHDVLVKVVMDVNDKVKQGIPVSEDQMKNVRFYAEKSRSAQPYFVNRTETAQAKPIEEVLDELDDKEDSIDDAATEAKKQMVATQPPVQNQEQAGHDGDIQTQPDATQAPS